MIDYDNSSYVRAYSKGRKDGERSVLNLIDLVLKGGNDSWSDLTTYYKANLEQILEVFNYGKEEKEKE